MKQSFPEFKKTYIDEFTNVVNGVGADVFILLHRLATNNREDRNPFRKLFFTFSFFFLALFSSAQNLHIVKDNVNCTYGLKNHEGKWIVEPTYILIQQYNSSYFLATDVMGDGIISPTGKQVIECTYDQIRTVDAKWEIIHDGYAPVNSQQRLQKGVFFQVKKGDQEAILNLRGQQIIELSRYDKVQFDGDARILIYGYEPLTTSYLDTSGNILINKVLGAILPFGGSEFSLHGEGLEAYSKVVQGDVRLINRKGEYPLNVQFDRAIFGAKGQICFERDGKYGEMTTAGKLLIEPKYKRKIKLESSPTMKNNWVISDEYNREGLMKPDGTVLLETIYDELNQRFNRHEFEKFWMIQKDGSYGVVDNEGKTVVSLLYDQINMVPYRSMDRSNVSTSFIVEREGKFAHISPSRSLSPSEWYDRMDQIGDSDFSRNIPSRFNYLIERDGKFGLLNADGTVLSDCIYELHNQYSQNTNVHYFSIGLDLFHYNFDAPSSAPTKLTASSSTDKTVIFSNPPYVIAGVVSKSSSAFTSLSVRSSYEEVFGNMMILTRSKYADWEIINVNTQEKIVIPELYEIEPFGAKKFLFETRKGKVGILDEDGNILVKPVYKQFQNNYKLPHLWALVENENWRPKWVLIDERGNQLLPDTLEQTFRLNSGDLLRTVDDKIGLFDTNELKWRIEPTYPCLYQSVGDFYIASEAINKRGIIRSDGTVLLPLEYHSIQLLLSRCAPNSNCQEFEDSRWLVWNGESEILVNQNGKMMTNAFMIRDYKMSLLFDGGLLVDPFSDFVRLDGAEDPPVLPTSFNPIRPFETSSEKFLLFDNSHKSETPQKLVPKVNTIQRFPNLQCSIFQPELAAWTHDTIRKSQQSPWSSFILRDIVFDAITKDWDQPHMGQIYYIESVEIVPQKEVAVLDESTVNQMLRQDCANAQGGQYGYYDYGIGSRYFELLAVGNRFVSIQKGYYSFYDDSYITMSQIPPPPPAPTYLNFAIKDEKAIELKLNDIFPSDSLLLQEFIIALQLRDDLKLDCSNLENMIKQINGKFSLSKEGVHLYYPNYDYWYNPNVDFLIPLERLKLHAETKWIVSVLEAK